MSCVATERQNSYGTLAELCGTDAKHPRSSREAELSLMSQRSCGTFAERSPKQKRRRNSRKTTTEQKLSRNDCREECRVGPLAASRRVFLNNTPGCVVSTASGKHEKPKFCNFHCRLCVERRRQFEKNSFFQRWHLVITNLSFGFGGTTKTRRRNANPRNWECSGPREWTDRQRCPPQTPAADWNVRSVAFPSRSANRTAF